ncbi:D-alanyl-D-alanine carboxypeptidase [Streptomyces xanthii]|uniref:D-alanyl-D-alanine carboxypeptidase n=1 Tax=Streptomyces xanthii TaxID=2768069 RepID=UPI001CB7A8FC|nr:D-alanyl-D-alanine carboxypeptidase [Streptomyces xanthii]
MAGTPDRSEQQTPGEDPRLAVARSREKPVAPAGVDQATAVFSVRDVTEGSAGSAETESAEPDSASPAEPGPEEAGDARLRAAVAAWVSSDTPPVPSAREEASEAASEDATEDATQGAAEDAAEGASEGASEDAPGDAPEDAEAVKADAEGDEEPEPADAEPADAKVDAGADDEAGPAEDAARTPESEADSTDDADEEPEPADAEPADAKVDAEAEEKAEPADAEPADAEPTPDAKAEDKPAEPKAEAEDKSAAPKPDAEAEDKPAEPEAKTDDKPALDQATAVFKAVAPTKGEAETQDKPAAPKPDAKADAEPKAKAEDKPAEPKAEAEPEDESAAPKPDDKAKADDKPAVDQATAVFKAVAPPKVDQPTTMLKSPAAKAPAAKPQPAPEPASERTSKFVPLKRDAPEPAPAPALDTPERTTQQPLPPKPPLDLLAELTNTPPPPETRVRTAVRRVKIWTPLVILLIVAFAIVQVVRPLPAPTLALTAQETVTFEGGKPSVPWPSQGQAAMDVNGIGTFGTSGDQKPVPIASIAKVMTVYLILRDHPIKSAEDSPKIPVDAAAQKHYETGKAENESVVKVTEGQKISEYEALQAVMLPSANNIAKLLARWDTGSSSEDAFVEKMNKTAKELGMKNTHYTDPSGLDKTTVSTAEDLVKLGRAAMENATFREIARQPSYMDLNGDKQNNFFGLVPTVAIGIKTGTTTAAGGNILFAAEKEVDGKRQVIIGAALGQFGKPGVANIDEVTGVVRGLIESGQEALTAKKIVKKGDVVGQVDDGLGGTTPVVATKDVSAVGWSGLTVKLRLDAEKGKEIPHAAKAGTVVGVLSVGDGKNDAVEVPVALQSDLTEPGFGAKIKRVS